MPGSTRIDELRQKFHENPRRYFAPLANEYRKAGDPEQAIAICRAHLAQQPGHMSGHVVYGQALYDARRTEEARGVFEKALALDPDNAIVLRQLGDIAREKGDSTEAKHWYSRALDADPSDREVAAYLAELIEPLTGAVSANAEPEAAAINPEPETAAVNADSAMAASPEVVATAASAEGDTAQVSEPEPALDAEFVPAPEEIAAPITPALAPQELDMVVEAPRLAEDREIEIEPLPEPEVVPQPETKSEPEPVLSEEIEESAAAAEDDVAWRKTPRHEESPFVTRTMAELYAKQGYREAALDVYRQLALQHPDDKEIFDRIEALEKDSSPEAAPAEQPKTRFSDLPFEPIISDIASEPPAEEVKDFSEPAVYGAEEEDEFTAPAEAGKGPHFTEMELGGDTWDTDAWGAGFAEHEEIDAEFDAPDIPEHKPETEPAAELPSPAETERQAPEPEESVAPPPELEPQVAQLDPQPVEPEPIELAPAVAEYEDEPETQPAEEPAFVAYSPQLPADDELPHFAPKGPTVREFFATLGAFRPSARTSITAHAAVALPPADTEDLPLATDAFATLFPDSQVSEDDSRAAFALSGALGASEPQPAPTPAKPVPAVEGPAPAAATQESEEDIRRFREWLDGLAES